MTDQELLKQSREAAKNSYSPYSSFPVGAAVIGQDDKLYIGCNIENASYGLSICAERVAIFSAVAAGNKKIKKLAVTCMKGDKSDLSSLMCCGACLQVISEFIGEEGNIIVDGVHSFTIKDLLPNEFKLTRRQ